MRFLADESCDFRIVRALRAAGDDVTVIIEMTPGAEDIVIFEMAKRERRIFVTEDRDFGQFIYAGASLGPGVIFLRYPSTARATLPGIVVNVVSSYGEKLAGRF